MKATRARYTMMSFILVLMAIAYLDRVCISMAGPFIGADLKLTSEQKGYVYSAFTLAYALFEVPGGWLADRFGPRLMLTRIVVAWSIMTALTGWTTGFLSLLIVRFIFGMGEAGAFPGTARVFSRWLPEKDRGKAFGLAIMAAALGGALSQPIVSYLMEEIGWRDSFKIFGSLGIVWAIVWYWWFRDDPHHHSSVNKAELKLIGTEDPRSHPVVPWSFLVRNRNLIFICLMYFGAIYGWYFYLTWFPEYLLQSRGFEGLALKSANIPWLSEFHFIPKKLLTAYGLLSGLPLFGIAVGVFIGGWTSDVKVRKLGYGRGRRFTPLIGFPAAALCILFAAYVQNAVPAAIWVSLASGFAAFGVASGWAVCLDIGRRHSGVVSGAMNTFGNFGGALSPIVIGKFVGLWNAWDMPLITVAGFYVVSMLCWLGIDASKPIPNTE